MSGSVSSNTLKPSFSAAIKPALSRKKRTPPVSVRFSDDERAWLEQQAAGRPLSAVIREAVLAGSGTTRTPRRRMPVKDHEALARLLGLLGRSEIGQKLGGILLAVKLGELHLDDEARQNLREACSDVAAMRCDLVKALGLRAGDQS